MAQGLILLNKMNPITFLILLLTSKDTELEPLYCMHWILQNNIYYEQISLPAYITVTGTSAIPNIVEFVIFFKKIQNCEFKNTQNDINLKKATM